MDALAVQLRTKLIQTGLHVIIFLQLTSFLWPQDTPISDFKNIYDFIIVGCGTAGSILANRLTVSGEYTVLVIEAGGDPPLESLYPSTYQYLQNSIYDWNFTSINDGYTAQSHRNHNLHLTSGKMLGGSSSLGQLLYIRGHPHDYDEWDDGSWSYWNLLEYFKKSENLYYSHRTHPPNKIFHGTNGPLGVTKHVNHINKKYLHIFRQAGHNILKDANEQETIGYFEPMLMIQNGYRQSTAYAFVTPIKGRPNLHVIKESEVTKISFNDNNAVGVIAIKHGKIYKVKCKREVIVTAGTIKSAQLLMLSGIGIKDNLEGLGINVTADLPVGKHYADHLGVIIAHKFNIINHKSPTVDPHELPYPVVVGNVAVDHSKNFPEYQTINYVIPSNSDSLLSLCSIENSLENSICESIYNETKGRETLFSKIVLLHPKSRGRVILQSKDYRQPPMVITGFYSHDEDLEKMASFLVNFRQISKTHAFKHFGGEFVLPILKKCNNYPSLAYWRCYALQMMVSTYQYTGTCAMKQVVDEKLKVYNINGLRVADASVIPKSPSGHTQAAVMAIAEKAADMILEDAKKMSSVK